MNLNAIPTHLHVEGYIKVACDFDPATTDRARTRGEFIVTARHHDVEAGSAGAIGPALARHPVADKLAAPSLEGNAGAIKEIPIRVFHNKAGRAISIAYQAYTNDRQRAPVCAGNGRDAQRLTVAADNTPTTAQVACAGPEACEFVRSGQAVCHRQVRMAVQIPGHSNPLAAFEVRSTSLNTYRALSSQLKMVERRFGGLRHVPLKLTLWQASNEASGFEPFDLMQLELDAADEFEALRVANEARRKLADAGINDDVDGEGDDISLVDPFAQALDFHGMSEAYARGREAAPAAPITAPPVAGSASRAAASLLSAALARAGIPGHAAAKLEGEPAAADAAHNTGRTEAAAEPVIEESPL